jgi:hypothetical protein
MGTVSAMKAKLRRVPTGARPGAIEELALAHALEECLEAMERGETDLDGLAGRYPDAAAEIRSLLSIAQELREKRVAGTVLSLEFKEEVRNRLLQRMER